MKERIGERKEGCVYVVGFDDDTVKIGRSISPLSRVGVVELSSGRTVARCYSSVPHTNFCQNESAAKSHFSDSRISKSSEWFSCKFDDAMAFVESLGKRRIDEHDMAANQEIRRKYLSTVDDCFKDVPPLINIIAEERRQFFLATQEALEDSLNGICSAEKALISLCGIAFSMLLECSETGQQIAA